MFTPLYQKVGTRRLCTAVPTNSTEALRMAKSLSIEGVLELVISDDNGSGKNCAEARRGQGLMYWLFPSNTA